MAGTSFRRVSIIVLTLLTLGYLTFCALLFFKQRSFIYFPTPASNISDPANVEFRTESETLRIWTRNTDNPDAVIYFGGNSEDVSGNFRNFSTLLSKQDLYFVNYILILSMY